MNKKKIVNKNQLFFNFDYIEEDLFLEGDIRNVTKMLPYLYDHQLEDVVRAEQRFKEGKGYLCTNGTGTGKTFVGLGLAKRFYNNDKKDILIVVPTDKKVNDWIKEGSVLNLNICRLNGIEDKGIDITVTTYANFYQNDYLARRQFDLIIYDECHYLNQNAQGSGTSCLARHREASNIPSSARAKAFKIMIDKPIEEDFNIYENSYNKYKKAKHEWDLDHIKKSIYFIEKTKVLFLSATPFAYHKNIKYADGTLYDIEEALIPKENKYGYNQASGFEKFLVENFGYEMKYNRITKPGPEVNLDLLERNFFENGFKKGIMSTRVLDLSFDYSREFITLDSDLGEFIDKGMSVFNDSKIRNRYPNLSEISRRKWNYNNMNQLLECIKAREVVPRIQQHLDLNRKVVIFHTYNNSKILHPFRFISHDLLLKGENHLKHRLDVEIENYNIEFSEYYNLDLSNLLNPRKAITSKYPFAKEFNGTVNKKKRSNYLDDFNQDYSLTDVLLVQTKAGREGISLHDTTGVHQRVLINLGLPTAPTQAIQEEGRIYRSGLKSNALYEYMTLQTNSERYAFATKIAERSKTAENLAMGNLARDLERSFKDGYANSSYDEPNLKQGIGGKEYDRSMLDITPFEKSKTYYFMKQKKNSKTKSKEGLDYFSTPEPLGFKMCEWIYDNENGNRWLEPSSGHGAIARFFPFDTKKVYIESSSYLASQLAINCNGDIKNTIFEEYYIGNKFDRILMNPPFGKGGALAIQHLEKACNHLYNDGVLLAIIPNGSSMNKRFDLFINDLKRFNGLYFTGEVILPNITFNRAGTSVSTRIVRIEKRYEYNYEEDESYIYDYNFDSNDFSYILDINEFFDVIDELEFFTKTKLNKQ